MIGGMLEALGRANLVMAAAILLVIALRATVRTAFGARVAYALWAAVPVAGWPAWRLRLR